MTKVIRTIPQRDEKAVHPVHTSGERLGASRTPAPSRLVSVVPRDGMFCNPHPTINRWATTPPGSAHALQSGSTHTLTEWITQARATKRVPRDFRITRARVGRLPAPRQRRRRWLDQSVAG